MFLGKMFSQKHIFYIKNICFSLFTFKNIIFQNYFKLLSRQDPPARPASAPDVEPKTFKLAKEMKCLAALMTVCRDLYDIHTILCLVAH